MNFSRKYLIASFLILLLLPFDSFAAQDDPISIVTLNMFKGFRIKGKWKYFFTDLFGPYYSDKIVEEIKASQPEKRIKWIAAELADLSPSPDFIVLQVAERVVFKDTNIDYLEMLKKELDSLGLKYLSIEFEAPIPLPLTSLKLTDRTVVLYQNSWETLARWAYHEYDEAESLLGSKVPKGVVGAVFFNTDADDRRVIAIYGTLLSGYDKPELRVAQAREALDMISATGTAAGPLLFAGDFNCDPSDPGDSTYLCIINDGFRDTFREANPSDTNSTCCNNVNLSNEKPLDNGTQEPRREHIIFCKSETWIPTKSEIILKARHGEAPYWASDQFGCWTVLNQKSGLEIIKSPER